MKRDTIREKSERGTGHGTKEKKSIYSGESWDNYWQRGFFFFCASKIAFTHSANNLKSKKQQNTNTLIHFWKGGNLLFRQARCWEQPAPVGIVAPAKIFPLASKAWRSWPSRGEWIQNETLKKRLKSVKETCQSYRCIHRRKENAPASFFFFFPLVKHNF